MGDIGVQCKLLSECLSNTVPLQLKNHWPCFYDLVDVDTLQTNHLEAMQEMIQCISWFERNREQWGNRDRVY